MDAYDQSGLIAPKLLRRFGITDGNRQTLTLGMLMTQLINPYRYGLFDLMYDCESPEGEKLIEYAEKDWKGIPHIGETPVQIIREVVEHGNLALAAIEKAAPLVHTNQVEFNRVRNDIRIYKVLADHYAQKAQAALWVLRYKYSNDLGDLKKALPILQQSVSTYKQLVALTEPAYLYANSMQTKQRKIPLRGVDGTFKTWKEVLVPFEEELKNFAHRIDSLQSAPAKLVVAEKPLINAAIRLADQSMNRFALDNAAAPFSDTTLKILYLADELKGLQAIQGSFKNQVVAGTKMEFSCDGPVKILVGFFSKKDAKFLKEPELETDASANDFGQSDIKIANALSIKGMPPVNIHSYSFPAGKNTLQLAKGACIILGAISETQPLRMHDAGITDKGKKIDIDWLFD